jgi:hypothetical protein
LGTDSAMALSATHIAVSSLFGAVICRFEMKPNHRESSFSNIVTEKRECLVIEKRTLSGSGVVSCLAGFLISQIARQIPEVIHNL